MSRDVFANRYTDLRPLGRGGFGVVYRAWDTVMHSEVALKLLNADFAVEPDLRRRFEQEATAARKLNGHPNITIVFDRGEFEGQPFIVMEIVEGQPLSSFVGEGLLSDLERLDLLDQMCDGLHYAHVRHIVHRDIKPTNLMVRDDHDGVTARRTLKILDFGIAKMASSAMTATGGQMFSRHYVSPEQILGEPVSPRTDMFAVGAVAYELFSGRKAFDITSSDLFRVLEEVKAKIALAPHTPLTELRRDLPPALTAAIDRALAKAPNDRFRDLAEMRGVVRGIRAELEHRESRNATIAVRPQFQGALRMSEARQQLAAARLLELEAAAERAAAEQAAAQRAALEQAAADRAAVERAAAEQVAAEQAAARRAAEERAAAERAAAERAAVERSAAERVAAEAIPEASVGLFDATVSRSVSEGRPRIILMAAAAVMVASLAGLALWQLTKDSDVPKPKTSGDRLASLASPTPAPAASMPEPLAPSPVAAPVPPAANTAPSAEIEKRFTGLIATASLESGRGRIADAVAALRQAERSKPGDSRTSAMLGTLLSQVRSAADQSRAEAVRSGAETTAPVAFEAATRQRADGERFQRAGRLAEAVTSIDQSQAAFEKAGQLAAAANRPAPPNSPIPAPITTPAPAPATTPSPAPPPTPTPTPSPISPPRPSPTASPTAPPVAAASPTPSPPAVATPPVDPETAVRAVLRAYEAAWSNKSITAIRRVWAGSANDLSDWEQMARGAESMSASITVESIRIAQGGNDATVVATISMHLKPRGGAVETLIERKQIGLARRNSVWMIIIFNPLAAKKAP